MVCVWVLGMLTLVRLYTNATTTTIEVFSFRAARSVQTEPRARKRGNDCLFFRVVKDVQREGERTPFSLSHVGNASSPYSI